ncbi:MAG: DUF3617 domain-containing protein [Bacteroidota bacterium]
MNLSHTAILVLAALAVAPADAADAPKRKSGLWEMKTQVAGMPSPGAIQICVDQATDNVMEARAKEKANCSVMDIRHKPGQVLIHSVCKQEATTSTSDAVLTGDFDSNYRNEMTIQYDPPLHGMSNMKMTQEAHWLGACKTGQKPGDVMMPGRPTMNMKEMMEQKPAR